MQLYIAETLIIAVFHLTDYYPFIYLQLPLQTSDFSSIALVNVVLWIWANGCVLEKANQQHLYSRCWNVSGVKLFINTARDQQILIILDTSTV